MIYSEEILTVKNQEEEIPEQEDPEEEEGEGVE